MTNDEMTKLVIAELGLQDVAVFDETAFVNAWIYAGTLDLLARTHCVVRCVNLNTSAGVDQYKLDPNMLALVDVENGRRRRANRADQQHWWGEAEPPFVIASPYTGFPVVYEDWRDSSFVLIGSDVLVVRPTPSQDGKIQVWGVLKPAKMTLPTDSPSDESKGAIPEEFHDAILTYAFWKGSSYGDDGSGQQGERYRVQYEGADGRGGRLAQIRSTVNKRGTARGPRSRVRLRAVSGKSRWTG